MTNVMFAAAEDETPLPESETIVGGGFKKVITYSRLPTGKIEKVRWW